MKDDDTTMISLILSVGLKAKVQKLAEEQQRSLSAQIRYILEEAVK